MSTSSRLPKMDQPQHELPYILALETATPVASVALFAGPNLIGMVESHLDRNHARLLTPMIQSLLDHVQVSSNQLDAIAVAKGPGSYTGLRVGVSTAKGLCMALDKPLLALGSLEVLAWQVRELAQQVEAWICPMIDARRMEVYRACFNADLQEVLTTQATIVDNNTFAELLSHQKVIFLGSGVQKCKPILESFSNSIVLAESLTSASDMGQVLYQKYQEQAFEDLIRFEPYYLKDFVATKAKNRLNS